jgi:hypothetical protein
MFFNYPVAACNDNWISSTLLDVLHMAISALQLGEDPPLFLESVPEDYLSEFSRGDSFTELYDNFVAHCRPLTSAEREMVIEAMADQNNLPSVFSSDVRCLTVKDISENVHEAATDLFKYAFKRLSALKTPGSAQAIRTSYHQQVYPFLGNGCCPFCGLEIVDAPDEDLADPDWDHYLPVSIYPFAGANLRNLTVMGTSCNRTYKGSLDVLYDENNQRVDCLDPYGDELVDISLEGSLLLGAEGAGPSWNINIIPANKAQNWRRIFNLDARLRANVLDRQYSTWLERLIKHAKKRNGDVTNIHGALDAIRSYRDECEDETLIAISIAKKRFFDLVESQLLDPVSGARTLNFLNALSQNFPPPRMEQ